MIASEYNKCVDNIADDVYRFALRITESRPQSYRIIQDCFKQLWQQHPQLKPEDARVFLLKCAFKGFSNSTVPVKISNDWDQSLKSNLYQSGDLHKQQGQLQITLEKGLSTLPFIQKTLMVLKDYEGLSYADIGAVTNLSETEVKSIIFKARKTLKQFVLKAQLNS